MTDLLGKKEEIIDTWVDGAHEAFNSLFPSKEQFVGFINSFKNREDAESFIRLSLFYLISKKFEKSIFTKLIMMISIIESLNGEYVPIQDWILSQDEKIVKYTENIREMTNRSFKDVLKQLVEDYYATYGSQRNVVKFFTQNVELEDKIQLIKSIRLKHTDTVSGFSLRLYEKTQFGKVEHIQDLVKYGFRVPKVLCLFAMIGRSVFPLLTAISLLDVR
jgi:hypothetical protein